MPIYALMDVGVSSDPSLVAFESRQDGKASEAPHSYPDASVSGNSEGLEAIWVDGEYAPSTLDPTGSRHAGEQHSDPHSTKINRPSGAEAGEYGARVYINGFSSSKPRLSPGEAEAQYDEKNHNDHSISETIEKNTVNMDGNCELASEACMEVPIVNRSSSIASDSQISLDVEYVDSDEGKLEPRTGKQKGRKPSKNSRRGRGSRGR